MQTARVTVLMTPDRKADLESRAARLGVSSGEYVRLAVDNYRNDNVSEEALATLVDEVNRLIPRMQASLDRSSARIEQTNRKVDALLRDMGVRS